MSNPIVSQSNSKSVSLSKALVILNPFIQINVLEHVEENMVWIILFVAGIFEVGFAVGLKFTEGFTKFWPSVFTTISMIISVVLLSIALRNMPIGTGYSVWTGIGTIGTVVFGIVFFSEPANMLRIIFIVMIIVGIVGLKFAAGD